MIESENGTRSLESAIDQIITSNERIQKFWTEEALGWPPREAAELLENSRMDRLVSLSHSLRQWTEPCTEEDREGRLILAWANLGVLVEGAMMWFLCVWEHSYSDSPMRKRNGDPLAPNELRFVELCQFFEQTVWLDWQKPTWVPWLTLVRDRRNAIHAFNHRDIGNWNEWQEAVVHYHEFLGELDGRVPYPDERPYNE
ncbi:MAG: hypothetical protein KDA68_12915 [Planctomycetaceae bacterium]|nr:hypothetical protein [Planctomycetaceae bacterium]